MTTKLIPLFGLLAVTVSTLIAADLVAPAKPPLKITPGKVIVPTDAMRRIWGELVSINLKTRTGTFRKEGTDEVMSFTVLPYAELLGEALQVTAVVVARVRRVVTGDRPSPGEAAGVVRHHPVRVPVRHDEVDALRGQRRLRRQHRQSFERVTRRRSASRRRTARSN